jgi:AraC family transcriptional regulator
MGAFSLAISEYDLQIFLKKNGQPIVYEGKEIPLSMYAGVTRFNGNIIRYDELFIQLHNTIRENK